MQAVLRVTGCVLLRRPAGHGVNTCSVYPVVHTTCTFLHRRSATCSDSFLTELERRELHVTERLFRLRKAKSSTRLFRPRLAKPKYPVYNARQHGLIFSSYTHAWRAVAKRQDCTYVCTYALYSQYRWRSFCRTVRLGNDNPVRHTAHTTMPGGVLRTQLSQPFSFARNSQDNTRTSTDVSTDEIIASHPHTAFWAYDI